MRTFMVSFADISDTVISSKPSDSYAPSGWQIKASMAPAPPPAIRNMVVSAWPVEDQLSVSWDHTDEIRGSGRPLRPGSISVAVLRHFRFDFLVWTFI